MDQNTQQTKQSLRRQLAGIRDYTLTRRKSRDRIIRSLMNKYEFQQQPLLKPLLPPLVLTAKLKASLKLPALPRACKVLSPKNPYLNLKQQNYNPFLSQQYEALVQKKQNSCLQQLSACYRDSLDRLQLQVDHVIDLSRKIKA